MASGYAEDEVMARHFRYASHAQVLKDHPRFNWIAVVDPDEQALRHAQTRWSVPHVAATATALGATRHDIEFAVIATPPEHRHGMLEAFPNLRAVLVEKPLGASLQAGARFLEDCRARGILVQVNLWRRADEQFRSLASGELLRRIGPLQFAFAIYGNGLANNGTHLVDFIRMLFGEIDAVAPIPGARTFAEGPIAGDLNAPMTLLLAGGLRVSVEAARFRRYREVGLDCWGQHGRLAILNEGLTIAHFPLRNNRAMTGASEIASDAAESLTSTIGHALFHMYSNVVDVLEDRARSWSSGASALRTAAVVAA